MLWEKTSSQETKMTGLGISRHDTTQTLGVSHAVY